MATVHPSIRPPKRKFIVGALFWKQLILKLIMGSTLLYIIYQIITVTKTSNKSTEIREGQKALQNIMESRVCGSPAIDGYAHVDVECLRKSPTAQWYFQFRPEPDDLVVFVDREADYDGLAVSWGIGNTKASVEECAETCRQHRPGNIPGPFEDFYCNAFSFCAAEVCFEPDAHSHSKGDCWLKFTEGPANPELNFRGAIAQEQRNRHPNAPERVQWHAGAVLPRGIVLKNGTWGPRYTW